jgi:hypothetical protein
LDVATADAPGLDETIRSGLVDPTPSDTGASAND